MWSDDGVILFLMMRESRVWCFTVLVATGGVCNAYVS